MSRSSHVYNVIAIRRTPDLRAPGSPRHGAGGAARWRPLPMFLPQEEGEDCSPQRGIFYFVVYPLVSKMFFWKCFCVAHFWNKWIFHFIFQPKDELWSSTQPRMTAKSSYGAIFFKIKCIFSTFKLLYFCHCIYLGHTQAHSHKSCTKYSITCKNIPTCFLRKNCTYQLSCN